MFIKLNQKGFTLVETVGSYEHSYNSGKLFWESFNIVRFVVKNRFGGCGFINMIG